MEVKPVLFTSEETDKFWPAFIKAQSEMGVAKTSGENKFKQYDYATLGDCLSAIYQGLHANELAMLQPIGGQGNQGLIETRIVHSSGQWIATVWPFSVVNDIQKLGALFTYLRRYQGSSMNGLMIGSDTDGADDKGEPIETPKQEPKPIPPKPKPPKPNPKMVYDNQNLHHKQIMNQWLNDIGVHDKEMKIKAAVRLDGVMAEHWKTTLAQMEDEESVGLANGN